MSEHISPQAAAAREAARHATGEFGVQAHTPPDADTTAEMEERQARMVELRKQAWTVRDSLVELEIINVDIRDVLDRIHIDDLREFQDDPAVFDGEFSPSDLDGHTGPFELDITDGEAFNDYLRQRREGRRPNAPAGERFGVPENRGLFEHLESRSDWHRTRRLPGPSGIADAAAAARATIDDPDSTEEDRAQAVAELAAYREFARDVLGDGAGDPLDGLERYGQESAGRLIHDRPGAIGDWSRERVAEWGMEAGSAQGFPLEGYIDYERLGPDLLRAEGYVPARLGDADVWAPPTG